MLTSLLATLALSTAAHAASPGKADICHWNGSSFQVIEVSTRAVPQHIAQHGDSPVATYFTDADGDGYGDAAGATVVCPTEGYVADASDCDDAAADVNPGAEEVAYDGIDNDCAPGTRDDDLDNDGFDLADDCDDANADVNPDAEEVCDNEVDDNCDGSIDEGCASDCPCFTSADIDAAYEEYQNFLLTADYQYEQAYAQCDEYSYSYNDGYYWNTYDYTHVYFNHWGQSYDEYGYYYSYEQNYDAFYGLSQEYNDYYGYLYDYEVCNAYSSYYAYDGTTYTSEYFQNYLEVTAEQSEACEAVIREWVEDKSMTCAVYEYTYP